jgi:hypothetical protein
MSDAAINLSWLINRARSFAGQNVTGAVDFDDRDFIRLLDQETLPTLSVYLPWMHDVNVDTATDRLDREGVYQIRTNERIIGVNKLRTGMGAFGAFPYDPLLYGDVLDRQLITDRSSASELAITFEFRAPNVVEVFPKGLHFDSLLFEMKMVHPTHLRTVPPGAREILRELFLCDLAIDILGIRQYFQSLQSVFGELNLNLDRVQAQADKREAVVEKLELKQLKHGHAQRLYIY